jgi:transcriptional regulator GlxA family with amidase domain
MRQDSVERVIEWMRTHVEQRAELPALAARAALSVPHFSVLFRRRTGYPPVDYFLRLKVRRACELLDTTTLRIEEIAASVGCADAFYFSRLFRRVMGKAPRDYRSMPKG